MNPRKYAIFSISSFFFLSLLVMLKQLTSDNYFSCFLSDTYQYTSWASQFIESLNEGIIYQRWTPLNFWGYGNPTFFLYGPLAFYMVAIFHIFSDSLILAMKLARSFSLFVSASGVFFLTREIYNEKVAFITGIVYIFFPFFIFDLYAGFFPSSISIMWFPLILFFIYKYIKKREYLYLLYAGVCYGGLIFTHLINAYMFTFIMIAFIIYMSISERKPKYLFAMPIIFVTGFAISSTYFLPFIYEKHFFNYQAEIEHFPIRYFFIFPKYTNNFPSDFFWRALYHEYLGYVILFFVITLLILFLILRSNRHLIIKKDINTFNKFFIAVSFFSLFMLFGPSIFLYETIPFFDHILPARWLSITAFIVVLLFSYLIYMLEILSVSKLRRYSLLLVLSVMCLVLDYKYVNSAHSFDKQELFPPKAINWLTWILPKDANVSSLDDGGLGERVVVTEGEGDYKVVTWESAKRTVDITAYRPLILRIRTLNFPGWTAYVNGTNTEIKTENNTGAILIDIPPGRHLLTLKFGDTPIVYYSKIISLVSFSGIIILVIFKRWKIHAYK
jgi:uncharacterized membrane protein